MGKVTNITLQRTSSLTALTGNRHPDQLNTTTWSFHAPFVPSMPNSYTENSWPTTLSLKVHSLSAFSAVRAHASAGVN